MDQNQHIVFTVDARQSWQATGLQVPQDAQVTIKYLDGHWSFNPTEQKCDANGSPHLIAKDDYPLPKAPEGALVGCLGDPTDSNDQNDHIFLVGNEVTVLNTAEADEQVKLYLIINDDIPKEYGNGLNDNSGSIRVDILVEE